jgi:hypothetical protein
MKPVYFSNSEFTVIYTQDIHKNIHTTSLEFTVHIHNIEKFNSQIVYSQHRKNTIFTTTVINIHVVSKYINRGYSYTSSVRLLQRCALGYRLLPSGKPHGLSLHVIGLSSLILPLLLAPAPPLLLPLFTLKKRKMSQIHRHHNPTPKIIRPWYNNKEINGYGFTSQPHCHPPTRSTQSKE